MSTIPQSKQIGRPEAKDLKLFTILTGTFSAILVLSPTCSSKLFSVGGYFLPGGVILFPIAFIFNDILTEVYGYRRSRYVIWTGLGVQVLAALTYIIVGWLPPAPVWPHQAAYDAILGFAPWIAIGSVVSYFCGEFANSFVLSKMKYWAKGDRKFLKQGWRFVASTIVGEGLDTVIVMLIAFAGRIPLSAWINTTLTLYVVKVLYEIIALPFSTRFANWVKKVEGIDEIDYPEETNYNPFAIFLSKDANQRSIKESAHT